MTALRILVDVARDPAGDGWTVRLTSTGQPGWSWPAPGAPPRRMRAGTHAGRRVPLPDPEWCTGGPDHSLCCAATAESVARAVAAMAVRVGATTGAALGGLLHAALLGPAGPSAPGAGGGAAWAAIGDLVALHPGAPLELALRWPVGDADLSGLPWELLHDGRRFLATSAGGAPVAVTRVLAGTRGTAEPLRVPPRVLFVVGTAATDLRVRPGAEIAGLLRAVRQAGARIHYRMLHDASPDRLEAAMETFRPDVVHIIAHGGTGPHGPYIVLCADDPRVKEEQRYAAQLAEQLTVGGRKPPVVVLSACETGALHVPGPGMATPFAADLVAGGVPVVAAMAGMVSDRACRLFTRRFGQALAAGTSIVAATAEARRLTFAADAAGGLDWALPAVFLADEDEPLPIRAGDGGAGLAAGWISAYGLEEDPVFCGRENVLSAFLPLLAGPGGRRTGWESGRDEPRRGALAICAEPSAGVGKTRTLREIARQALLDGHLPVLVGTGGGDLVAPRSHATLCSAVSNGIEQVRLHLGLTIDELTESAGLADVLAGTADADPALLNPTVRRLVGRMPLAAMRMALQLDLAALLADARRRWPHLRGGRAVLLLDNLDQTAQDVLDALLGGGMLGEHGLGDEQEPLPVVLMISAPRIVDDIRQGRQRGRWLAHVDLAPLSDAGDEDLFAYEQVMLHPFLGQKAPGFTDRPWAVDRTLTPEEAAPIVVTWRRYMKGLPYNFVEGVVFPLAIEMSFHAKYVLSADDDVTAAGL
ncbi:hypothetical protein GCM10009827_070480 [Dactylosporangium maewongense]|uniref:CHAT domain-containing protein n=1 Tax=Dactylosporangium maewongense TaxID=634393 RepID=A0ABP4MAL0_9ACTN